MVTELCIQANTFQYDGKLYRQVKGVLMGSPASFVLAELIMQSIEKPTLSETEIIIWILFFLLNIIIWYLIIFQGEGYLIFCTGIIYVSYMWVRPLLQTLM